MSDLLSVNENGLYCAAGDFYIDPWNSVDRAVITHAHSDHARWGSRAYLTSARGLAVLHARLGDVRARAVEFGETVTLNGVRVSLHPAGHILGSAQVRVEHAGEVWVVSGDYKTEPDVTCDAFELVRCNTFITESTFGLPIYRWHAQENVFAEINEWWRANAERRRTSVLFGYSLGKAQRLIAGVDTSIGPIMVHGALERFNDAYRAAGIPLPPAPRADNALVKAAQGRALVVAPPSATASPWMRRFDPSSTAFASGWMSIRGARRRRSVDRGFALSDHVDWTQLLDVIQGTGAENVWATHGYTSVLVRWLLEHGVNARAVATRFEGDEMEDDTTSVSDDVVASESGTAQTLA